MAFYGFKGDVDECYWTPYSNSNYASTTFDYSSCEFGEPESSEYNSSMYYGNDESYVVPSEINHSIFSYSEPKIIQYDPTEYHVSQNYHESLVNPSEIDQKFYNYNYETKLLQYESPSYTPTYFPSETKFTISYSQSEFNEDDFEEYDSTPYGGGYDSVTTYGKPLPPSDKICYPRSVPNVDTLADFSYGSITKPFGKNNDLPSNPSNVSQPVAKETDVKVPMGNGSEVSNGVGTEIVKWVDVLPSNISSSSDEENDSVVDYGYGEIDKHNLPSRIPYGYGLESMDICESIFGYWPCLAKIEQQQQQQRNKCNTCDQVKKDDPWEVAADYLFGNPIVSNYENNYHRPWA